MRIIDLDPDQGRSIAQYGSVGLRGFGLVDSEHVNVVVLHVEAGGQIGRHPATQDQLFVVVQGTGTVCGEGGDWRPIRAGQAALWAAGENHTTTAEDALTAIVIEMPQMPIKC